MPKYLFIGLIAALLLVVFAVQNAVEVTVRFLFWEFNSYLSLIITLCLIFGVVIGWVFTSYTLYQKKKKVPPKQKEETVK